MPSPSEHSMVHDAVVWQRIGTDNTGRPIVSSVAEEIRCRWDGRKRNVPGQDGEPITVDASMTVDNEVRIGSAVVRGTIDDLPGSGQTPERDVYEVVSYDETWDVRGVECHREAMLVKAGDTLPDTGTDPNG